MHALEDKPQEVGSHPEHATDRRALLAGLGGLAAGTFLTATRAEAGSLTPPAAPAPTGKPLTEIEPRIAINDTNTPGNAGNLFRITKPGSYYLTGNITGETGKNGILIMSSNVTIDLMGFAMLGVTGSLRGIATSDACDDLIIRNGTIRGWGSDGINLPLSGFGYNALIEGVISAANGRMGIRVGNHAVVRGCLVEGNTQAGISCNTNCTVEQCSARNVTDFGIITSEGCRVANCSVWGGTGTGISVPGQCLVEHNQIHGCQAGGILVAAGSGTVVQDNTVRATGNFGLKADTGGHTFRNNSVRGCKENYDFAAGNNLELLISQIPQMLSWPCVARLEGTLQGVAQKSGILIGSSNVTLDLMGFALIGVQGSYSGVIFAAPVASLCNISVLNGSICDWGGSGIDLNYYEVRNGRVDGIVSSDNQGSGLQVGYGFTVSNCTATRNGNVGIVTASNSTISNCASQDNINNSGIAAGYCCTIVACATGGNGLAGITASFGSTITNCSARYNGTVGILVHNGCTIAGCSADENEVGIEAKIGSMVLNCTTRGNTKHGIEVSNTCTVRGNTCRGNGNGDDGAGILVTYDGNRIEDNHCHGNDWGIRVYRDQNFIARNTCAANTTSNWSIASGNNCLVVLGTNAGAINGDSGGVSPGSTDPNANYTIY